MTDDELFVARMADLANLTDKSLITEAEIDRLIALARIGAAVQPRPISEAPKDGTAYLLKLKMREEHRDQRWNGLIFVARHPGLASDGFDTGWNFAAPVGMGGFVDADIEWCIPLSALPQVKP